MSTNEKSYKIIETIENGNYLLSAIPQKWESNGKLMWPPTALLSKALKNPSKVGTSAQGWTEYNCIVKRSSIPTYEQAIQELRAMSDKSDTSEIETQFTPRSATKRTAAARKILSTISNADNERFDFNNVRVLLSFLISM